MAKIDADAALAAHFRAVLAAARTAVPPPPIAPAAEPAAPAAGRRRSALPSGRRALAAEALFAAACLSVTTAGFSWARVHPGRYVVEVAAMVDSGGFETARAGLAAAASALAEAARRREASGLARLIPGGS